MRTPRGEATSTRRPRLSPGPGGRGGPTPTEVSEHQRERLRGAIVELVARHGFAGTTLRELVALAGVSKTTFYDHFEDKQDCFLAAVEELRGLAMGRMRGAECHGDDPEERVRAAIGELLEMLASEPASAHACLVNIYEAGPAGQTWAKKVLRDFERLAVGCSAASPRHAGLPREIVAALVAGVQMVIHRRLRRGEAEELPALAPVLADWVLGYAAPPRPLPTVAPARRRRGRRREPGSVEERLLEAVADICARDGVTRLTGQAIVAEARTSYRTLYDRHPGGAEDAFVEVFKEIIRRCVAVSEDAYALPGDWPEKMDAVNRELFAFLAAEPAWAKTVLVEVLGAGPRALAERETALEPFGELLRGGQELAPEVPPLVREAIVYSVYSLVAAEIEERGTAGVPRLVPLAGYIEFAPYLGAAKAASAVRRLAREGAGGQETSSAQTSGANNGRPKASRGGRGQP